MKFISFLVFGLILLFNFTSCSERMQKKESEFEESFMCNAEEIDPQKKKFSDFSHENIWYSNINTQSDETSHSGKYSSKLFPGSPYGLTVDIPNIRPDDYIQVTAWRKSKNDDGVIVLDGGGGYYTADKYVVEEGEDGWQKIYAEYFLPPIFYNGTVKVYVWNNSTDTVYFDDLTILHRRNKYYPDYSDIGGIQIHVDEDDISRLRQKRLTAFETTILVNSDEDYSNMVLFDKDNFYNGELRLKGDLLDHLNGQKWSFRIKLKKDFAWEHMRTFSIQNPSTRFFVNEWLAHKIFDQEDVLTTRYGFVPVQINKNPLGIYAWEEHFEKQLVESRNRREGPIIRFNENLFWQRMIELNKKSQGVDIDYFSAAKIIPFKEGQITSDSLKVLQFEEAQNLLTQYRNRSKKVSEIFDVDKLAAYYALIDITQSYHGFAWHNQRFYYNPVTCLLEPIAFDGFIEKKVYKRFDEPLTGLLNPKTIETYKKEEIILFQAFSDSVFNSKYIDYLKEYSSEQFVENIILKYKSETDSISEVLKREFPYYHFEFDLLQDQASFIRNHIADIQENICKIGDAVLAVDNKKYKSEYSKEINPDLISFQVHAYYDKGKNELEVLNFTNSSVKVLGAFMNDRLPVSFEKENELLPFNGFDESRLILNVESEPVKLLFSINNQMYETEISKWKAPKEISQRQLLEKSTLPDGFQVTKGSIVLDGSYQFSTDVVIPKNMQLIVKPGTKIDLVQNAGFFCFSPVKIEGTKTKPIEIFSSDRTANGFNVIQPHGHSNLKFVHFSGLGSIRKKGWQTPAAITLYEADVDIENCIFASNSNCDDALNIVRSDFDVQNCSFENTFADAFDSDFCTGIVSNCSFQNIGNDAIDFSGSQVKITDCKMFDISDKAISGGEKSTLSVSDCSIEKANIGIASKDLSLVKLNKIEMETTVYGLVVFQKKPEYGPAKIEIDNLKMKDNVVFHQIEVGSTLILNGKIIEGREKKLALKLYQ